MRPMFFYRNGNKKKTIYNEYQVYPRPSQEYSMTHVLYHWLTYLESFWSDSFTLKKNVIEKRTVKKQVLEHNLFRLQVFRS